MRPSQFWSSVDLTGNQTVGGVGSSSYNYGTYGSKVKRAPELQENGLPIEVISEDQLFSSF